MAEEPAPASHEAPPLAPIEEYDRLVAQIEAIVERLESGDLTLAEALLEYQRGVELIRLCNDLLDQAELRVTELATGIRADHEAEPYRAGYQRYFPPLGEIVEDEENGQEQSELS
jgi:exodeoxyribonuclease VII small subunit